MKGRILTKEMIGEFSCYLKSEEKSKNTIAKYLRDVRAFAEYLSGAEITKETVIAYKNKLLSENYAVRSMNSMLASLNSLLNFLGWEECKVKSLKIQRQSYCSEEKELTKEEYLRLLKAAERHPQLKLVMETICGTGIRVSELSFFTVDAVRRGKIQISCKSKIRTILIPGKLRKMLLDYGKHQGIREGVIFRTKSGRPLSRSYIWAQMKKLCPDAGVMDSKVFPHNLRKLFARIFYKVAKDIVKLADVLGHSSINTTRIYIMTTGEEHRRQLERLGLVV